VTLEHPARQQAKVADQEIGAPRAIEDRKRPRLKPVVVEDTVGPWLTLTGYGLLLATRAQGQTSYWSAPYAGTFSQC